MLACARLTATIKIHIEKEREIMLVYFRHFSHKFSVFHATHLPETDALLAGYSALINAYDLQTPIPELLAAISNKHLKKYQENRCLYMLDLIFHSRKCEQWAGDAAESDAAR